MLCADNLPTLVCRLWGMVVSLFTVRIRRQSTFFIVPRPLASCFDFLPILPRYELGYQLMRPVSNGYWLFWRRVFDGARCRLLLSSTVHGAPGCVCVRELNGKSVPIRKAWIRVRRCPRNGD